MDNNVFRLILASGSPRRKELLEQIGLTFEICAACGEEKVTGTIPAQIVETLSAQKAAEVAQRYENQEEEVVVIGADTLVAYGDRVLGKPENEKHAKEMLGMLQGKTHQVYTGVTLIRCIGNEKEVHTFSEKTEVTMYEMSEKEIADYVSTGEPMDKAGAYAIQGKCALYVKGICGDYNNVVGLPVARLMHEMKKLNIKGCNF